MNLNLSKFWSLVQKTDSCWIWTGSTTLSGHAQYSGRYAYRISWELTFGPIPKGLVVCHACDNPSCVNPGHLWLGTQQANLRDASVKGRLKRSDAFKNVIRAYQTGRTHSEDAKKKISEFQRNRWNKYHVQPTKETN